MHTPPKPRAPATLDAFTATQFLADRTPGSVPVIHRFAPQNLPPSPQPKAKKGFTCIREIPPALEVCVTRPPAPSPRAPSAGLCLFNCDTLKFPRVPARVSEALVLRTYPLKEADLVVSFLTRDQGMLRGVARRARRPKSSFGAGLERLSRVRMAYFQKETRELVNLDGCELIQSQFALAGDYQAGSALAFLAEISEQLLPAAEPNEKFFRLLAAALDHLHSGQPGAPWLSTTYFALWALRLSGLLPELHSCLGCGGWLDDPESPARAFFQRSLHGLFCQNCRRTEFSGAP